MTLHENLQQRAALHARMRLNVARQIPHGGGDIPNPLDPDDDDIPPRTTSTTTRRRPTPTPNNPDDDDDNNPRPTSSSSTISRSTSSTSSSTSSTLSTTSTTSTSTTETSTTPIRTTTSASTTPFTSVKVVTSSKTVSSAASSASSTALPSNSSSTGAIVGGIGGGIVAAIVIGMVVAFIIRRMRRKRDDRALNFDPDNFRRSAVLLPDDNGSGNPTMMEKKPVGATYQYTDVPQAPSSAYGTSEMQYNNYGAASQYSSAPGSIYNPLSASRGYTGQYEQPDFGAPPMPGQYGPGTYSGYGASAATGGYPARQQYQQEYPSPSPYQRVQQHVGGYGAGAGYGPNGTSTPASSPPSSEHHGTSASINPITHSVSNAASTAPFADSEVSRGPATGLSRQPTQSAGSPPSYDNAGGYAELKRDEKVKPVEMSVQNGPASAPSATNNKLRPTSAYTVYDPEDAYGGV